MWLRGTPHVPVPELCSGEHIQKFYHKINITLALLKLSGIYQIVRQSCMGSYDLYCRDQKMRHPVWSVLILMPNEFCIDAD